MSAFKDFVLLQLDRVPAVTARAMFGGWGLYSAGTFFGVVWKDRLYLRVGPDSAADYTDRGMPPFKPFPGMTSNKYFEVPADVLESGRELAEWAGRAVAAAASAPKSPRKRKRTK
jgi:DNA transformation protein